MAKLVWAFFNIKSSRKASLLSLITDQQIFLALPSSRSSLLKPSLIICTKCDGPLLRLRNKISFKLLYLCFGRASCYSSVTLVACSNSRVTAVKDSFTLA